MVDSLDTNQFSILQCFKVDCQDAQRCFMNFFSGSLEYVYVDNCANMHISNNRAHFVTFCVIRCGLCDRVLTVGGDALPAGEGTV